jgi:hypothetical protein
MSERSPAERAAIQHRALERIRVDARVAALRAAVDESNALLLCQRSDTGLELTTDTAAQQRSDTVRRAAELEQWILREEGTDGQR